MRLSILSLLSLWTVCGGAVGSQLSGTVSADGRGLAGAIVTAQTPAGISVSVYAAGNGAFRLRDLPPGPYKVRARAPGFEDATVTSIEDGPLQFVMHASPDPLALAPSSTFLALLPDGVMKRRFVLNCGTCHEINHSRIWKDGAVRDAGKWAEAIELMKKIDVYAMVPPGFGTAQYAEWLASNLSPARLAGLKLPPPADPAKVGTAVITEYSLPEKDELPHDVAVGPDGRVWITAFWHSEMWAMDPKTGAIDRFAVNTDGAPAAQTRAVAFDRQGRLWIVLGGTKSVVRLDPKTREIRNYPVDMYAHDIVLDSRGDVWLNDYFSKPERIARLSSRTGKVTVFALPTTNLPDSEGKPLPYGLQIDREDRLWSTQLAADTLVRFDTRTLKTKLYRVPEPHSGPRRHGIGPDGSIWIPEFNDGYLLHFDPKTETFTRYDLGDSAIGAYDLVVDQRNGAVWITGSLSSLLLRFDPVTKAIERYPLPTEPAYMRHLAIDPKTGAIWSAYSSLPAAVPKVVRLIRGK
jgi:streptogramin lyase